MHKELKNKAVSGFIWTLFEKLGFYLINFIISIILARILGPKEFGLVAMILVFMSLLMPFMEAGLNKALIRKTNAINTDFSTVFWWNITLSLLLYLILYLAAPIIAKYYNETRLIAIVRVYSLNLILIALNSVQNARLVKELNFKVLTIRTTVSSILAGSLAIYLAWTGWTYWSLVIRDLFSTFLSIILLWVSSGWRPKLEFSKKSFNELFGFGSKLLITEVIDTFFNNIYPLIIGKFFSVTSLGFYNRAKSFTDIPQSLFTLASARVTYPLFAKLQNENKTLILAYKKILKLIGFVYFPILMIIMGLSEPIVRIILTKEWLPVIPILRVLAFVALLYPVHSINLNILLVKGRSDLFLKLEIYKKILTVLILIVSYQWGLMGLIYGQLLSSVLAFFINTIFSNKFLEYGPIKQLKDLAPSLLHSILIGLGLIYINEYFEINNLFYLLFYSTVAIVIYVLFSWIMKNEELNYVVNVLKPKLKVNFFVKR
ncbi:hypothetical protein TH61_11410 [Rufibacter sp. DG15C]|uniref:lipopolysaccharide biosynthesis protein n=1 Tax=Rufibacter sp. DG15C TaxID=1379909 RepID=UPI00078D186A|nr:lipopolysaccharide biosynthesis protein [Rufibacter sp. DG15C]AMM51663.1 hypothetical protein TH61_11410 [Rufibacter sp. DG15C]